MSAYAYVCVREKGGKKYFTYILHIKKFFFFPFGNPTCW